jgi:transcriptional regulator with XRE-family HTH domain
MLPGERLREARNLVEGLSAKEVDRLAGITEGHTWLIEKSKTGNAETKTLDKIARVFGFTLDYLIRGEGSSPAPEEIRASVQAARAKLEAGDSGEHPAALPPKSGTDHR